VIHVTLSGSPYQLGYEHGRALRPLVDAAVRYESRRHAHLPPPAVDTTPVERLVSATAPALLEELQGIADGAGLPFDLLLAVNLQVLHYCTVIAFPRAVEGPLLGKNLDFPLYAYQVLFTVQPEDGHSFTHVGCAGSVASYGGLNRAGLATGHAAVLLRDAPLTAGMPLAFLRRLALQHAASTHEAVALVGEHEAWQMGDNLLFLDRAGDAAVVEIRPGEQRVRESQESALWCTNCFATFEPAEGNEEGQGRHRALEQVLGSPQALPSRDLLHGLLTSHEEPYPLCRDSTQLSFIAHPATGSLEVADGYPCQVPYQVVIPGT
jgi:predicted choloylglycine hydrolase